MPDTFSASDFAAAASSSSGDGGSGGADTTPSQTASAGTDATQTTPDASAGTPTDDPNAAPVEGAEGQDGEPTAEGQEQGHEPPKERWDAILNNAREKAKAEVLEQFKWAQGIDPEEAQAVRSWMEIGNENPMQALDTLIRGIAQQPNALPYLQQYFHQLLGIDPSQGQPQRQHAQPDDEMPQPDIPTDVSNGQPVVYSAQQLQKLLMWQAQKLRQEITQEFQSEINPLVADHKSAQEQRQRIEMKQQADQYAARAVGEISKQPGFAENKDEIARVWDQMPRNDGRTEGERLFAAYIQVVAPKLSTKARQDAVAAVGRKAGATTVNPGAAGQGSQAFDYKKASWADALKHEAAKRGIK